MIWQALTWSGKAVMKHAFWSVFFVLPGLSLPAQQAAVTPQRTCAVEGQVVKAATGEPLKKAWLTLRKMEGREPPYGTSTDASGHFVLKEIEPGRYRVWVERSGYVPQEYGQRALSRPGTILALEPGQHLRDIVFRLIPVAVVTGRVYGEDGEPITGAQIQAFRRSYEQGQLQLVPAGGTTTNDLGEYRLHGLVPGRYYLTVNYTPRSTILAAAGGIHSGRAGESGVEEAYAPTYYPGTNDPGRAAPLELRPGDEVRAVDFTLLPTRALRVRGRVFNSVTGQPGRGAILWLAPRDSGIRGFLFRNQTVVEDAQGVFEVRGVTPGSYILSANWFDEGKVYAARQSVEISSANLDGINLVIDAGLDLTGRVRIEGNTQIKFTDLRVSLHPRDYTPTGGASASVKSDGTFVVQNVAEETHGVTLGGMPEDFYLAAVRMGTDNVLEAGLTVSRGRPPGSLELVLSPAGGRIDGVLLDKRDQPFGGALVVLVPEPRRRGQAHFYKSTTTDQYGRFILRGIPPGEYKLFAWEDIEPGAYQDPEFMRPYEQRGESLRIGEGSRHNIELKLIPADASAP